MLLHGETFYTLSCQPIHIYHVCVLTEFNNLSRSKTAEHVTTVMLIIINDVKSLHFLLALYVEIVMR